ncbi:MAG TPA: DUF3857 domain-containing protein [Blastocatellia bacterium]|nr:DUF3857 domain-containing protein [Blastocatellia bacterium]
MTYRSMLGGAALALICLFLAPPTALAGDDWKPVDPALLSMKSPVVEKDADAEAIFWEVRMNDAERDLIFQHYIRIKVFTERGKESESRIDIPYLGSNRITDIAGRTIKPDGAIVELKKEAIFDRTIVRAGGFKFKAKSFAMPAVEPGVIIEYRWREVRPYQLADNLRLQIQREIPVHLVKYSFKPLQSDIGFRAVAMSYRVFNGDSTPMSKDKDGFYTFSMSNVPAFHEEPRMPPESQIRTWVFVYYSKEKPMPPSEFWPKHGKEVYESVKPRMKVNDDVKRAAATAIADATTPEQKLERIFDYCRARIKNVNDDASGLTAEQREKLKENQSPSDTLKRGMGTGYDIDMLFAALATAAGFEARLAQLADRSDMFFDMDFTNSYFIRAFNIAVKVGSDWRFFDPAGAYIPFGMLRWQEEGAEALVTDPKQPAFVRTPLSPPEKTVEKRTAQLQLSDDGTVEGDVRIEYTGHLAMEKKEQNDEESQQEREQTLLDMVKSRMSTAEISNIRVENVTDPVKPFVYAYHVRVPGYAQRTGKRLFLQPAFFEKGIPALFAAAERKHQIYFHYPWLEQDEVRIKLPAGFALDNADAPAPFNAQEVIKYDVRMSVEGKSEALIFKRTFRFNGLYFPTQSYGGLKQVFDALHESDNHTITLKQVATNQQD